MMIRPRTVLLAIIASCAHAPAQRDAQREVELAYTLSRLGGPTPAIEVTVSADAAPGGTTTFDLGEGEWGVEHPELGIGEVRISDARGQPLAFEHPTATTWTVRASGRLELRYRLLPRSATTYDVERHGPFVTDHLVHLLGLNALVYPAHLADGKRHISLTWAGFAEAGWKVASSFGSHPTVVVHETREAFRNAVFVASDELRVATKAVGSGTLEVAVMGKWPFADSEIVDLLDRVITAERAFFDDPGPPYFFVAVMPAGSGPGTAGDGLTHSFAAFLGPGTTLTESSGRQVRALFAHEHFHNWNGQVVTHPPDDADSLTYWVTEGFTDYYTWLLLYRAGLVSLDDYVASVNELVSSYILSPARAVPNAQIEAEFWRSQDVSKIPYFRGALVAMMLNRELARSHRSVDDVMRGWVADARAGKTITTTGVLASFEAMTSVAFVTPLRATIVDGATLAIDLDLFAPCMTGTVQKRYRFDPGFETKRSLEAGHVIGLRKGSAAELAGLRDGQTIDTISVWSDPDRKAALTISDNGTKHAIEYLPRSAESFEVPTFAVADPAACRTMLGASR